MRSELFPASQSRNLKNPAVNQRKTRRVIKMENNMPRQLSTITHKGKVYFRGDRLREFRPIEMPFAPVPFNSDEGREISEGGMNKDRIV